jgi:hypothetical protein
MSTVAIRTSLVSIVLGLSVAACAGATSGEDGSAATSDGSESEIRSTGLSGTYEVGTGTGTILSYQKLTLKTAGHTFTAQQGDKTISGTWSTPARARLVLEPSGSDQIPLTYSISGASLYLRATFHGPYSVFLKDGVKLPMVDEGEVCSDRLGNITAECPDNFFCEFEGNGGATQRCLPPF